MKKKQSILPYIIMVIIGVGCCLLLCERVEQVGKWEVQQNEKIN